jgi:hypothetical protein
VALYLLDARVASLYPHLPLFESLGLGIALLSYSGTLAWGLTADWELVPRLARLRGDLERSFAELLEAARVLALRAGAPTPRIRGVDAPKAISSVRASAAEPTRAGRGSTEGAAVAR